MTPARLTAAPNLTADEASALLDLVSHWRMSSQEGGADYDDDDNRDERVEYRKLVRSAERKLLRLVPEAQS